MITYKYYLLFLIIMLVFIAAVYFYVKNRSCTAYLPILIYINEMDHILLVPIKKKI